ncbi:type II and III secretion system protein family protein [Xylophilus sp. GW821-FHT01B05]
MTLRPLPALLTSLLLGLASPAWPADAPMEALAVLVGAQQERVFEAGVDRVAIADESVAGVAITRKGRNSPAARLFITGKAPGSTTVMVWEKGAAAARIYAVDVRRRVDALDDELPGLPEHRQALEEAAAARGDKPLLLDRTRIGVASHTVQVDVRVVEFSKTVLQQAGLNIMGTGPNSHGFNFGSFTPSSLSSFTMGPGGAITATSTSPYAQAFNLLLNFGKAGIGVNLSLLEGNGLARVLAAPTLVALSGQSASFLAGGEIPVPVPQGLGTVSIRYKPFGIGLTLTPTVLSDERIVLKVAPEASDLDYTNAVTLNGVSVPAITTRRADTTVELGDGESFAIGGLVSRTTISNVDKVPMLGDLPILGAFFKRQNYQQKETELVIIVTPRLVKPMARGTNLDGMLPGRAEQTATPGWSSYFVGKPTRDALPGFSR